MEAMQVRATRHLRYTRFSVPIGTSYRYTIGTTKTMPVGASWAPAR
jgi:hypothetical protein